MFDLLHILSIIFLLRSQFTSQGLQGAMPRLYTDIMSVPRGHLSIYKNVFCWLCNAESDSEVPASCSGLGLDAHPASTSRFSALINYRRLYEADKDSHSDWRQCSVGEIYDKYFVSQGHFYVTRKGTSRQRSGKGAITKRFPLQKPRWENLINNQVLIS